MKNKIIPIAFLFLAGYSSGQVVQTENYIYSKTYISDPTLPDNKTSERVEYIDGLGRTKQIVNIKATPESKDEVIHFEYDQAGRQAKNYLPVPQIGTQNGGLYGNPFSNVTQTPYGSEKIFSEQKFEDSPLNRVKQQFNVGNEWLSKPVNFSYDTNIVNEVRKIGFLTLINDLGEEISSQPVKGSFYDVGTLYKYITTDEDNQQTITFVDKYGNTILVRKVLNSTTNADTYYIYNTQKQLIFVIPPEASKEIALLPGKPQLTSIPEELINKYFYQYKYDEKNRLIEKKIPGKGWEFMVYDKADRLIMTQDADLAQQSKWMITKYDQFGRVIYTGIIAGGTRESMQDQAGNLVITETRNSSGFTRNGMQIYYSNGYFLDIETVLSVNYYDTYPLGSPPLPPPILGQPVLAEDAQSSNVSTKSLPTASYVKNIEDDNWTKNYIWYDKKGRVIGSHSINHLGGYTKTESKLDFSGTPLQAITRHKRLNTDTERVIVENFTYDHQNRLMTHTHQVDNNQVEYLAQNTYNELSQLKSKKVGGSNEGVGLQTVDYQYNIRGWMTHINDPQNLGTDLFGYKINYNLVEGSVTPNIDFPNDKIEKRYNGNIAEVSWRTLTQENDPLKTYGYSYDKLNRLSAGFYQREFYENSKEYFEKLEYDLNGNITILHRSADAGGNGTAMKIDYLKYDYTGNRLTKITDLQQNPSGYPYFQTPNSIEYDNNQINGNGNMTKHVDKGISSIQYNYLNLPKQIIQNSNVTNYTYRADGVKVKKLFGDIETNYLDGFQYKSTKPSEANSGGLIIFDPNEVAEMKLRIIPTSEGYFDALNNKYIYNYTDHLGNVRLSYSDTNNDGQIQPRDYSTLFCQTPRPGNPPQCLTMWHPGEIVEVNNYYPFGLLHNYTATTQNAYQYKYNSKELQETGMYDYGARFYMPDIGRWGVMDALAEKYTNNGGYNYAINNPMRYIDPDGNYIRIYFGVNNQHSDDYTYKKGRDYDKLNMPDYLKDTYKVLDALYEASNVNVDGKEVNLIQNLIDDKRELSVFDDHNENTLTKFKSGVTKDKRYEPSTHIGSVIFKSNMGVLFDDKNDLNYEDLQAKYEKNDLKGLKVATPLHALGHEIGHAYGYATNASEHAVRQNDLSTQKGSPYFRNAEEKRVNGISQQIDINLKKTYPNIVIRKNHNGFPVITTGPTSNTIKR